MTKEGEIHRVYAPEVSTTVGAQQHTAKKADVDTKNERIDLGGKTFSVPAKIAAFDVKMDGTKVDKVALITREELVSGDVKAGKTDGITYILDTDGDLAGIAVQDFTSSGNTHFGFVKTLNVKSADIDYGIKFYDDSKVYEITADEMKALKADGFYRYELSGDKVTFVENKNNGTEKVDLIDLDNLTIGANGTIDKVTNGVYKLKDSKVEFTVEDNTRIFEITYDKDGEIYDIKAISSVGRGDVVTVQTREQANNVATEKDILDSFEKIEAEYVVVHNYASGSNQNQNQQTVVGDAVKVTAYTAPTAPTADDGSDGSDGSLTAGGKTYTIAKTNTKFEADTVKVNDWVKVTATGTVANSVAKVTLPADADTIAATAGRYTAASAELTVKVTATEIQETYKVANNVAVYGADTMVQIGAVTGKTIAFTTNNAGEINVIIIK